MSRFCLGLALWALLLALAACGGDSKGTDPKDAEPGENVDTVVPTFDDLPSCTRDHEGATAYVEDEKKAYVCESKRWTANDSLTGSILDKDSDSAEGTESGEKVDVVVSTFDDLPSCTRDLNGKTAYVEDEDSAYVCKKGLWVVDDSLTKAIQPDSEKKSSSSAKAKSSSSKTSDSSSKAKSSSSKDGKSNSSSSSVVSTVSVASPCKTEAGDNCEYGTLTDDRDGQTYKTVKIGEQWWMAENLNYRYIQQTADEDSSSYCYNDKPANCAKYGRLYLWSAAMDSAGIIPGNSANGCGDGKICNLGNVKVRGVCPEGWHLPSRDEWNTLFTAVGGSSTAGEVLKSTSGWNRSGNGSDNFGFSALPAALRDIDGGYGYEGYTFFWSSTERNSGNACLMGLRYCDGLADLLNDGKSNGFSVRCLKDYESGSEKKSSNGKSSSSDEKNSSSSSVDSTNRSSSSEVPTVSVASPCKTETEDNCEYGTLTDDRDGQTYKTVKIGEQWWMAENLNYAYTGVPFKFGDNTSDSTSWCYDNDPANCAKYGRLYLWSAAMDSAGIIPGNTANGCGYEKDCNLGNVKVRGVCPEGWHLPSRDEWDTLLTAVGGKATAGIMLKSMRGWNDKDDGTSGNGSDSYFFSALPAGNRSYNGGFNDEGYYAYFWSSTEIYSFNAYYMYLVYYDSAYLYGIIKYYGFSVRCLKD